MGQTLSEPVVDKVSLCHLFGLFLVSFSQLLLPRDARLGPAVSNFPLFLTPPTPPNDVREESVGMRLRQLLTAMLLTWLGNAGGLPPRRRHASAGPA